MTSQTAVDVDLEIGYMFKVVQNGLHEAMDRALRDLDLNVPTYAALTRIQLHPDISKAELAREIFVRPQSMTRVMAGLTDAGLIVRPPHRDHGRILQTRLTAAGEAKLAEAGAAIAKLMSIVLGGLDDAEREQFLAALTSCRDQLQPA